MEQQREHKMAFVYGLDWVHLGLYQGVSKLILTSNINTRSQNSFQILSIKSSKDKYFIYIALVKLGHFKDL